MSKRLAVPLFLLTWPIEILNGHLALTFAVFVGVYVATKLEPRVGAADGKLMVGMAAFAPLALGMGVLLEVAVCVALRLHGRRAAVIRGALWLYLGASLGTMFWLVTLMPCVR